MITKLFEKILDILFPKAQSIINLESLISSGDISTLPKAPETPESWMHALFAYKDTVVRDSVWQIKYAGNTELMTSLAQFLSEEILAYFEEQGEFSNGEWLIVPVPSSPKHKKEKGFNQTEELVVVLMRTSLKNSVSYIPNVLTKIKETKPQAEIKNRSDRLKNLIGAFFVPNRTLVHGKKIIVIDDVLTTGSTVTEAKRALMKAGAREVLAFTIAH